MKKKYEYLLCGILCSSSMFLAINPNLVVTYPLLAVCKYICTAFAIVYTTIIVLNTLSFPKLHNYMGKQICTYVATCSMLMFSLLCLDTFLFHVLTWIPGIVRYAIFNAYGILYLVFIIPGILWYLGSDECIEKN